LDELDEKLYDTWEERWSGSVTEERLTGLGRLMFRAKKRALSNILPVLAPKSIMEVGCGLGHILSVYHEAKLNCRGIDVSRTAVAVCRNKGLNVELKNVEDETETFDMVSSDGMLEHFIHFEPMAQEMMRISQRYVLIIQPNHGSFWGKTLPYLSELIKGEENVLEYNYRIIDFINIFERGGFSVVNNLPVFADVFRILVFERSQPVR
jgi:SAM-dependent methyltransferase